MGSGVAAGELRITQEEVMKTTVLLLSLGAVTIAALIFVAQNQGARAGASAGRGVTAPAPIESLQAPAAKSAATIAQAELSHTQNAEPLPKPEAAPFEGDPWQAGVRAYEAGDFELAVVALEQAVAEREDSAYRHYLLGLSYRRIGESEGAVEELSRSLSLAPSQPRAYAHLGRAWLDLGELEAAREAVDGGLECDLEHADLWQVLGRLELAEGRYEEAAAAFARTTELDPTHRWAWNNLGYTRLMQGRYAEAVNALQRATAHERAEASFFNNLGHAMEQVGDLVAASDAFARAEQLGHAQATASQLRVAELLEARDGLQGPALLAESN